MTASPEAVAAARRILAAEARRILAERLEAKEPPPSNLGHEDADLDEAGVTA